jgi:hypothetical protein
MVELPLSAEDVTQNFIAILLSMGVISASPDIADAVDANMDSTNVDIITKLRLLSSSFLENIIFLLINSD